jgi:hypothetical protein
VSNQRKPHPPSPISNARRTKNSHNVNCAEGPTCHRLQNPPPLRSARTDQYASSPAHCPSATPYHDHSISLKPSAPPPLKRRRSPVAGISPPECHRCRSLVAADGPAPGPRRSHRNRRRSPSPGPGARGSSPGFPASHCLRVPPPTPDRFPFLAPSSPLLIWSPPCPPGPAPPSRPLLPPLPQRAMASGSSPRRRRHLRRGHGGGTPMAEGRTGRRIRGRFHSYRRRRRRRSGRPM